MDPPSKRRRLAPKVPEPPPKPPQPTQYPPEQQQAPPHYPAPEAIPAAPERHDFEAFARHLQDAAIHIQRQAQQSPYTKVSVLLLRWEEDTSVDRDLGILETVLGEKYHFNTDRWNIPTVPNPSIKLTVQLASFLEQARPAHLLIIYYAGYSYVGADNQLYWACNSREDAAKLRWDSVRLLIDDAQSDILLLLDSCAIKDAPLAGSHGVKQAIAACLPDQRPREPGSRAFTSYLVDSLTKLATRPFSVQQLYDEILLMRHHEQGAMQSRLTNGENTAPSAPEQLPIYFTLTPGKRKDLILAPICTKELPAKQSGEVDGANPTASREDHSISPGELANLTFDEDRVLVCTTFVGEASPDMAFFNQWLGNTPALGSKIAVEGMFIGPPTMLLISMPVDVWNIVQPDRVCCFLGYVRSHNMLDLYHRLRASTGINTTTAKDVEDGRILLEARQAAASSPAMSMHNHISHGLPLYPETPSPLQNLNRQPAAGRPRGLGATLHPSPNSFAHGAVKDDGEETAEMKEAAEQLKALSHIRHLSGENHVSSQRPTSASGSRHGDQGSTPGANESGVDENHYSLEFGSPTSRAKGRKPLKKQTPSKETRCDLCSHAPFKDSSSLRKHVAAAHTRPFPCAFSFAGCTSTFGSKNEWKRHIASQHLCLQYYRCSTCQPSSVDGKGNEFNRKDLFTQHLRRMHAPFSIKKTPEKADPKLVQDWENHLKEMQVQCLVQRRHPPQRSACPKPDCQSVFEGLNAWDEWTEHVGRHMEKNEAQSLDVDPLLAQWALDEGIIERLSDGEYKLCGQSGSNSDKEIYFSSSFASDAQPKASPPDEEPPAPPIEEEVPDKTSITVATALAAVAAGQEREKEAEEEREREKEKAKETQVDNDKMEVDE